jgi:hemerythrin-like metal-binding protein
MTPVHEGNQVMGQQLFQPLPIVNFDADQLRCIDRQHTSIYTLVQEFNMALRERADRDQLLGILEEIIARSQGHFATEERMLFAAGDPGYAEQSFAHRLIIEELTLFHAFVLSAKAVTREQCIHAMDSLLVHHIKDDPTYFANQYADKPAAHIGHR